MSKEVGDEYSSSLADLNSNSKPLINMLTILAEENVDHAAVIVESVEKHLKKVRPDIKLPVLYLVDSIIKNVGGDYTKLFSQTIVNMFCETFKQVDEKTRSQMFKLRETWNEVFPNVKLYQLDVKVNLIDPAWPIQAQPPQSNIHLNPNFLKKPLGSTSASQVPVVSSRHALDEGEKLRNALAQKEKELLLLQQKKIEMELEQTRRQLQEQMKAQGKAPESLGIISGVGPNFGLAPIAMVPPHNAPVLPAVMDPVPAKQRLGPPVASATILQKGSGPLSRGAGNALGPKIAPVSSSMIENVRRRDPRLARQGRPIPPPQQVPVAVQHISPNVFDIKPLDKTERNIIKSKNAITIDIRTVDEEVKHRRKDVERKDPRRGRAKESEYKRNLEDFNSNEELGSEHSIRYNMQKLPKLKNASVPQIITDLKRISKLPPIPKINRNKKDMNEEIHLNFSRTDVSSPTKRRKENSNSPKPEKKLRKSKDSVEKHNKTSFEKNSHNSPEKNKNQHLDRLKTIVNKNSELSDKTADTSLEKNRGSPGEKLKNTLQEKLKETVEENTNEMFVEKSKDSIALEQKHNDVVSDKQKEVCEKTRDSSDTRKYSMDKSKGSSQISRSSEVEKSTLDSEIKAQNKSGLNLEKSKDLTLKKDFLFDDLSDSNEFESDMDYLEVPEKNRPPAKKDATSQNVSPSKPKTKSQDEQIDISQKENSETSSVTFKEVKISTKERNYMRRNREKSESPETQDMDLRNSKPLVDKFQDIPENKSDGSTVVLEGLSNTDTAETKDIDLRLLAAKVVPEPLDRKRHSTEDNDQPLVKKSKADKFDRLFGNEDVDLRTFAPTEKLEVPPPPVISEENFEDSPKSPECPVDAGLDISWAKVKAPKTPVAEENQSKPLSKLDLARAKLAEAKSKDRLGRPLLYNKLPDNPEERKRTMSLNSEDVDMRTSIHNADFDDGKSLDSSIKIIMSQAEEELKEGNMNQEKYNELMIQVLQLNEKQKLIEAKQRESLEASKRKLQKLQSKEPITSDEDYDSPASPPHETRAQPHTNNKISSEPKESTTSAFGDIDERIVPLMPSMIVSENKMEVTADDNMSSTPNEKVDFPRDCDLRVPPLMPPQFSQPPIFNDGGPPDMLFRLGGPGPRMFPCPPGMFVRGHPNQMPIWRGSRGPPMNDWGPRNSMIMRGPIPPPYWRASMPPPPFNRLPAPFPPICPPLIGTKQMESPLKPYVYESQPPMMGDSRSRGIPAIDLKILEYIDQDPMKTIDIDEVALEIRYYGETAIVLLDWDDPREISFFSGERRLIIDNKETFTLSFNSDYTTLTLEDQTIRVKLGSPTRELYINERWFECYFGGPPINVLIENKVRSIQLERPPPKVHIGTEKRLDFLAGKINMIIDAVNIIPIFLDAKPQKFELNNTIFSIRFVDSLKTILINEKPFSIEFGGLPKPLFVGKTKYFVRFTVLPKHVKPGQIHIKNMEGLRPPDKTAEDFPSLSNANVSKQESNSALEEPLPNLITEDNENSNTGVSGGLDMLASIMPAAMAPASQFKGYSLEGSSQKSDPNVIPGLENPEPNTTASSELPFLNNVNVSDLFAKLLATGIVKMPSKVVETEKKEDKSDIETDVTSKTEVPNKFNNKTKVLPVNLQRPETLKVAQPGLVAQLYGGMQCSGCGARFPPERTVRYSQHLDWHFRQNRRERDSARRAHSRNWHYDISDWIQYEEIEDLEEREKSWFETSGASVSNPEGATAEAGAAAEHEGMSVPAGLAPHDHHCALCGDKFDQFYDQDKEEWHLRKAIRHEDKNYHPQCYEDYKASLTLSESIIEASSQNATDKMEIIEMIDDDDNMEDTPKENEQQENDDDISVVEIVESESQEAASQDSQATDVQVLEDDDDDVVLKAEPVEQIVVEDADTDDETEQTRAERDKKVTEEFDFSKVKIKQEPVDADDEPVITAEEELVTHADTTSTAVVSSLDGNVQLETTSQIVPSIGGIRINITKPVAHNSPKDSSEEVSETVSEDFAIGEPPPPGEEEETTLDYALKPGLENVEFSKEKPVQRGSELSGLCSIM